LAGTSKKKRHRGPAFGLMAAYEDRASAKPTLSFDHPRICEHSAVESEEEAWDRECHTWTKEQPGLRLPTSYTLSSLRPVPAEKPKAKEKKSEEKESKSIFSKFKKKEDKNWTCSASLFFENDKLVRVTFAHKDVRSPYQWQSEKDPEKAEKMRKEGVPTCTFSLPRCAPAQ
jgi:hypothetical protein